MLRIILSSLSKIFEKNARLKSRPSRFSMKVFMQRFFIICEPGQLKNRHHRYVKIRNYSAVERTSCDFWQDTIERHLQSLIDLVITPHWSSETGRVAFPHFQHAHLRRHKMLNCVPCGPHKITEIFGRLLFLLNGSCRPRSQFCNIFILHAYVTIPSGCFSGPFSPGNNYL